MKPIQREKLTDEQQKLIVDVLPFVYWMFNKLHIYNEDTQQNCLYAICKYIHLYDPSKGSITTFVGAIIKSRKLSVIAQDKTYKAACEKMNVNLEDVVFNYEGDPVTWADLIGNTDERLAFIENKDFYDRFMIKLYESNEITEKEFCYFVSYLNVGNQREVARMYGCSVQNINSALRRVRMKAKNWKLLDV